MDSKVVLSLIVAAAMVVSPAFAAKNTRELKAVTPKQVVEQTGS